ncbi:MAG: hypothetical protein NT154_40210 [Verrucomicrobia bacterium]|nr:hypothetical protein [Verrucomicrobiota bacterium]
MLAQDIIFTNRTATFTNLDGRLYTNVTLVKATADGIIWKGDGMGMVPYTKLSPEMVESFGIPQERVEQAKAKAAKKAQPRWNSEASGLKAEAASKRHQAQLEIEAGMSSEEKLALAQLGAEEARREFRRYDYGENPTDRLLRNYNRLTSILGTNHNSIITTNMSISEKAEALENLKLLLQTMTDLRDRAATVDRDIKQLEIDSRQRFLRSFLFGD